jgi:hypothetical protein
MAESLDSGEQWLRRVSINCPCPGSSSFDITGMRAIAELARSRDLSRCTAPPSLERHWRLAERDTYAPTVRISERSSIR